MSIDHDDAVNIARQHLNEMEAELDLWGSALPRCSDWTPTELVVTLDEEIEDGWIFSYNTRAYVESQNIVAALTGNYPIFISRLDGEIHCTSESDYAHLLEVLAERQKANKTW
jgi:hypothetical protein